MKTLSWCLLALFVATESNIQKCKGASTENRPPPVHHKHMLGTALVQITQTLHHFRHSMDLDKFDLGVGMQWATEHAQVSKLVEKTKGVLDAFIEAQKDSGDACHARMLEAKRALDELLGSVRELETQISGHEEVITSSREDLLVTQEELDALKQQYEKEIAECKRQKGIAKQEHEGYQRELTEMQQIANPEVRGEFDSTTTALLQVERSGDATTWTRAQCRRFTVWKQKSLGMKYGRTNAHEISPHDDCERQRSELQQEFNKAYKRITELSKEAKERMEDTSCSALANAKYSAAAAPLLSQREAASKRIEMSAAAVSALQPVLSSLTDRIEAMEVHIRDTLTPECKDASAVSKHLDAVRELIRSLEKCPGRGDLKLTIPKIPDTRKPPVPLGGPLPLEGPKPFGPIGGPLGGNDVEEEEKTFTATVRSPHTYDEVKGTLRRITDADGTCLTFSGSSKVRIKSKPVSERNCVQWTITRREDRFWGSEEHSGDPRNPDASIQIRASHETNKCLGRFGRGYFARRCTGVKSMNFEKVSTGKYCVLKGTAKEDCMKLLDVGGAE